MLRQHVLSGRSRVPHCCVYVLQNAPPQISARGRSDDLSTILSVIDDAHRFVHISVMDYLPLSQYTEPLR